MLCFSLTIYSNIFQQILKNVRFFLASSAGFNYLFELFFFQGEMIDFQKQKLGAEIRLFF